MARGSNVPTEVLRAVVVIAEKGSLTKAAAHLGIRSRSFVLSPGAPLPIVTWIKHDWMTDALTRSGVPFKIVFNGEDYDAKKAAVECSVGISALPRMLIRPPLVEGKEYYLPKLPLVKNLVCARPELAVEKMKPFLEVMSDLFHQEDEVETMIA
ncbi:hypothetical protein [Tardiphaga sp.]|uniref:hypothetical protein n=1 Tax=Tardiphaga sp. TaxID=1926292 RepID=UPI002623DDC5|nr:hypothetical protein [Tardiphaga sp.]MDB5618393.1 LysR family transcriptional regulator [Tardiphaga sp.]